MSSLISILTAIFKRSNPVNYFFRILVNLTATSHFTKTVLNSKVVLCCWVKWICWHSASHIQMWSYSFPTKKKSLCLLSFLTSLPWFSSFSLPSFLPPSILHPSFKASSLFFLSVFETRFAMFSYLTWTYPQASAQPRAGIKGKQHYAWHPLPSLNCFGFYFLSIMLLLFLVWPNLSSFLFPPISNQI